MKRTLEEQRIEFSNQKFLATPLSGLIVWTIIGFIGIFLSEFIAVWSIFIGTGSIVIWGCSFQNTQVKISQIKPNQKMNLTCSFFLPFDKRFLFIQ